MSDLVLDVGPLADFLAQYFNAEDRSCPRFAPTASLTHDVSRRMTTIASFDGPYIVVTSAVAIVELVRQWDEITEGRFQPYQLAALLDAPPDWFSIDPLDEELLPFIRLVPSEVIMPNGELKQIEWTDAVHVATKLARDNSELVTTDHRLWRVLDILDTKP